MTKVKAEVAIHSIAMGKANNTKIGYLWAHAPHLVFDPSSTPK